MHRSLSLWVVMLGLVGWALSAGGRTAGAAPTRLVVAVPDVNPAVNTTSTPSFDISWVDPTTHTYYLADRSNASIDIIDIRSATFIGRIPGFQGVQPAGPIGGGRSGPNGVVVLQPQNQLWAGDGNSTVKVVDLAKGTIINSIDTGGTNRADELAYDAADGIIVIANDAEPTPTLTRFGFYTFISTTTQTILGKLQSPDATNGIEQPAWSPTTGLVYVAVPATTANPGGEIAVIDPRARTFVNHFGLTTCTPHGLALGPHPFAIVGCNDPTHSFIMNITTGATIEIPQVSGSDQVTYNPGDNRYYLGASANTRTLAGVVGTTLNPVLGIVDAGTNIWIASVPTAVGASKVAADPANQQIFVALTDGAVGIYTRRAFTPGAPLGAAPAGPAGPAGATGATGAAGATGPAGSSGGCALSPGAAFDPVVVGLLGLLGLHLGLRYISRRRG